MEFKEKPEPMEFKEKPKPSDRKLMRFFSNSKMLINILENADMNTETSTIYWFMPESQDEDATLKTGAESDCFKKAIFEMSVVSESLDTKKVKLQLKDSTKVLAVNFCFDDKGECDGNAPFFEMISLTDPNYDPGKIAHEYEIVEKDLYISLKVSCPKDNTKSFYWHVDEQTSNIVLKPNATNAMVFLIQPKNC